MRKTLQDWKQHQPLVLMMHEPDAADTIAAAGVKVGLNPTEAGDLMAEIVKGL